jgi:hypothetical protein
MASAALCFAPSTQYEAYAVARGVEITDLNGDGRPDLIVSTWAHVLIGGGDDLTMVFLNKGDGTFEKAVEYARRERLVAVGDLNRDGKPDLVVTARAVNGLAVLLNRGDGSFTALPAMGLSTATVDLLQGVVGDVDGDGIPDLSWSTDGTLNALRGNGDGTFASTPVTTTFADVDRLQVVDLDGDGVVDVITTGRDASFHVFLNDGTGTFPSQGAWYASSAEMTGWLLVDWNQDGNPDIFTTGTSYVVLLNDGKGKFETRISMSPPATPGPPHYMTVADMNGDGQADIVDGFEHGVRDTIEVWLNDGHDEFGTVARAEVARFGVGIQAADLDGDGRLDLVSLSHSGAERSIVSVLLNRLCSP